MKFFDSSYLLHVLDPLISLLVGSKRQGHKSLRRQHFSVEQADDVVTFIHRRRVQREDLNKDGHS